MRPVLAAAFLPWALACAPTVHVATEKPIQIALDVRIRLDDDLKELVRAERQDVAPRGLEAQPIALEDAGALAAAKRAGRIGERRDGYLALPKPANDAALEALAKRANAARRRAYEALAEKHGVASRTVESVAGERRVDEAAPGELVANEHGAWVPKGGEAP